MSQPLRVGFIAPDFPPELGGVQTYAWELCSALARAGVEVTVLAPPASGGHISPETPEGMQVVRALRLCRRADAALLTRHDVDIWHGLTAGCSWLVGATSRPVLLSIHGNDLLNPTGTFHQPRWRERLHLPFGSRLEHRWARASARKSLGLALRKADAFLCNSHFTATLVRSRSPQPQDRTIVTGMGLGESFLTLPEVSDSERNRIPEFVTVARLDESRKNIDVVLKALATLPDDLDWRYTVVGDGHRRAELAELADRLDLAPKVCFTGPLTQHDLVHKLQHAHLFVLTPSATPYTVEGFGIVYLEANACGLPVLAARTGGVPDAIEENVSGWMIDQPTPENIGRELHRFIREPGRFRRSACIAHARRHTWDAVAARCLRTYSALTHD